MTVPVDRSLRLRDSEYFPEAQRKSGIALHHTVCDSACTTVGLWRRDTAARGGPNRVATAFVIDRDGTIFEAFDPAAWAWQFGLSWRDDQRIPFEQRFIGIEIWSEGGQLEQDGRLYAYDRVSAVTEKPAMEALDCGTPYPGYRWFGPRARAARLPRPPGGRSVHPLLHPQGVPGPTVRLSRRRLAVLPGRHRPRHGAIRQERPGARSAPVGNA